MKATLIISLLVLVGCSDIQPRFHGVDPELAPYISMWILDTGRGIGSVNVSFKGKDLHPDAAGLCMEYGDEWKSVFIDRDYWDYANDEQRKMVIYHELGHCVLGQHGHRDRYFVLGGEYCPESIMNTYAMGSYETEYCYKPNESYYLSELLGN